MIHAAKRPGHRAQKLHVGCVYELQSAQRVAESFVIDLVYTRIWGDNPFYENENNSDNDDSDIDDGDDNTYWSGVF